MGLFKAAESRYNNAGRMNTEGGFGLNFSEKLRALRLKQGMSLTRAAEMIGVGRRTYIDYEQGRHLPRYRSTYEAIARVFGCDVNRLLTLNAVAEPPAGAPTATAEDLTAELCTLFRSDALPQSEKTRLLMLLQRAYWETGPGPEAPDGKQGK